MFRLNQYHVDHRIFIKKRTQFLAERGEAQPIVEEQYEEDYLEEEADEEILPDIGTSFKKWNLQMVKKLTRIAELAKQEKEND